MKIPAIKNVVATLIKPKTAITNPKRIVYEIGQTTMYADAGKGSVFLGSDGTIYAYRLKNLGISTLGSNIAKPQKIIIQEGNISGNIATREKDIVTLRNCKLPAPKPVSPKYQPIVNIVYTNRP